MSTSTHPQQSSSAPDIQLIDPETSSARDISDIHAPETSNSPDITNNHVPEILSAPITLDNNTHIPGNISFPNSSAFCDLEPSNTINILDTYNPKTLSATDISVIHNPKPLSATDILVIHSPKPSSATDISVIHNPKPSSATDISVTYDPETSCVPNCTDFNDDHESSLATKTAQISECAGDDTHTNNPAENCLVPVNIFPHNSIHHEVDVPLQSNGTDSTSTENEISNIKTSNYSVFKYPRVPKVGGVKNRQLQFEKQSLKIGNIMREIIQRKKRINLENMPYEKKFCLLHRRPIPRGPPIKINVPVRPKPVFNKKYLFDKICFLDDKRETKLIKSSDKEEKTTNSQTLVVRQVTYTQTLVVEENESLLMQQPSILTQNFESSSQQYVEQSTSKDNSKRESATSSVPCDDKTKFGEEISSENKQGTVSLSTSTQQDTCKLYNEQQGTSSLSLLEMSVEKVPFKYRTSGQCKHVQHELLIKQEEIKQETLYKEKNISDKENICDISRIDYSYVKKLKEEEEAAIIADLDLYKRRKEIHPLLNFAPTPTLDIDTLKLQVPKHWRSAKQDKPYFKGFLTRSLDPNSEEYKYVRDKFAATLDKRILSIDAVENPHMWLRYKLKCEEFKKNNITHTEVHVFHGTNRKNVRSILRHNFDWKRHGEKIGNRYGCGVSFARNAEYALKYTDKHGLFKLYKNVMFMVRTMDTSSIVGNYEIVLPPSGFHSSVSEDLNVLVKYGDDEFYPEYIIYFDRYRTGEPSANWNRKPPEHFTRNRVTVDANRFEKKKQKIEKKREKFKENCEEQRRQRSTKRPSSIKPDKQNLSSDSKSPHSERASSHHDQHSRDSYIPSHTSSTSPSKPEQQSQQQEKRKDDSKQGRPQQSASHGPHCMSDSEHQGEKRGIKRARPGEGRGSNRVRYNEGRNSNDSYPANNRGNCSNDRSYGNQGPQNNYWGRDPGNFIADDQPLDLRGGPGNFQLDDQPFHHRISPGNFQLDDQPFHHRISPGNFQLDDQPLHLRGGPGNFQLDYQPLHLWGGPGNLQLDQPFHLGGGPTSFHVDNQPFHLRGGLGNQHQDEQFNWPV